MAHVDARLGKWRGNWRMEWVASTLHTTSEHGVSSITIADAHTPAASNRLNWRPRRFKWTRPFRRWTKSGFCACAITFQTQLLVLWRCPLIHCSRGARPRSCLSPTHLTFFLLLLLSVSPCFLYSLCPWKRPFLRHRFAMSRVYSTHAPSRVP
jgi:hypothetical protein